MNSIKVDNVPSDELNRRDILRVAAGLGLTALLPAMDALAAEKRGPERKKSLITLWMAGGPSQLETWDPHPGGLIGGPTRAITTKIPGLKIAEYYPQVAEEIEAVSVIRSLVSKEGDHERGTYFLKTGYRPNPVDQHPSLGAILTHQLPDARVEIPQHVSLGNSNWPSRGGYLGDQFDAFKVFDPGNTVGNMRTYVKTERQQRRLSNLNVVSAAFQQGRAFQTARTLHQETIDRALKMMSSKQLEAFRIDDEPDSLKKSYGDSKFGRGCLVATRLVEVGVRAVEVTLQGFDSHANNLEAHRKNAAILDPALASLLRDLKARDLLDSTLVLCIGEFGRTPKINSLDGRDHWPTGFSCLVGGAGLKSGLVIGKTDPTGEKKDPTDPVHVNDLFATILTAMGVDPEKELITPIGRPLTLSDGSPLTRLL